MWFAALILARDAIVFGVAAVYRGLIGGLKMAPTWLGKMACLFEFVLLGMVLAAVALWPGLAAWLPDLLGATALLAAASGLHYVWLWSVKTYVSLRALRS